jgi:hypothetical protein
MCATQYTRRQALQLGGASLLAATCAGSLRAQPAAAPKKILYFTKSAGFEHSVVKRDGGQLSHSEKLLVELGQRSGFDVTPSKDGRVFDGQHAQYDAFVFYTSGDVTTVGTDGAPAMTAAGKRALLDAVSAGKGFLGIHAATDSFRGAGDGRQVDPYIAMIGGEFVSHGEQQTARMTVVNPRFPGLEQLGSGFELHEEWYALRNFAPDLHVLLIHETEGMRGDMYARPPFPATWARRHGDGRVFYTSLGHREDVWTHPTFEQILTGALRWVTGQAEVDIPPNMTQVTPGANTAGT